MSHDQVNPTKDWTKTLVEYLFDHLKVRSSINVSGVASAEKRKTEAPKSAAGSAINKGKTTGSTTPQIQPATAPFLPKNSTGGVPAKVIKVSGGSVKGQKDASTNEMEVQDEDKEKGADQDQSEPDKVQMDNDASEAIKNWYAKLIYIMRLIYWNYNEGKSPPPPKQTNPLLFL